MAVLGLGLLLPSGSEARWSFRGPGISEGDASGTSTPTVRVKLSVKSIRAGRFVEGKKLRQSVEYKLPHVGKCYQFALHQAIRALKKKGNAASAAKGSRPLSLKDHTYQVRLTLNRFGRAIKTRVPGKKVPPPLRRCTRWYMQGRKFFPPEGKRSASVTVNLHVKLQRLSSTLLLQLLKLWQKS